MASSGVAGALHSGMNALNAAANQLGALSSAQQASQMSQQQQAYTQAHTQPPVATAMSLVAQRKEGLLSKAKVLEYIEAQMKMDLFGDDLVAERCFHTAMEAASREIMK